MKIKISKLKTKGYRKIESLKTVETFFAESANGGTFRLEVKGEEGNNCYLLSCGWTILGWTDDPFVAFSWRNNAGLYTYDELVAGSKTGLY